MPEQEFIFNDDDKTEEYPVVPPADLEDEMPVESDDEANKPPLDFEKSLNRLECIVDEMENGQLSLDTCMKYFEEGTKLARLCSAKLDRVEKKVEILIKDGTGSKWTDYQQADDE